MKNKLPHKEFTINGAKWTMEAKVLAKLVEKYGENGFLDVDISNFDIKGLIFYGDEENVILEIQYK